MGDVDIRKGFEAFTQAAQKLEASYAELQVRAQAIDLKLAQTNKVLEDTLLEREMVFRSLPIGVLALRPNGELSWSNPEGSRLLELATENKLELLQQAAGELEVGDSSLRVQRVALPDGGMLVLVEDRSQVVQLEREVDRLDRLAGLSELALGIAHEIKNPLNGVMGFASLMQRPGNEEKQQGYAAKVNEGLTQIDSIVKALLAFARPAEKVACTLPLPQIVSKAAAEVGVPMTWVRLLDGEKEYADGAALLRVLGNLFRNSAESKNSGEAVQITVSVQPDPENLVLLVADDGPGIPQEQAQKIFQPFVSSKDRGHGLGLALVCRVLTFLNGSIELVNPGAPGAVFRIRLPRVESQKERSIGN